MTMLMKKRKFQLVSALLLLVAALLWLGPCAVYAKKGGKGSSSSSGKGSKSTTDTSPSSCSKTYCFAVDDHESLSPRFLLHFDHALSPSLPLCMSTKRQLELEFIVSYNYLARLNCDTPCFRRAVDAFILAAPPNAFIDCQGDDNKYGDEAKHKRNLRLSDETNIVVEVALEQTGDCSSALDGKFSMGDSVHPASFVDSCGAQAWAWDFSSPVVSSGKGSKIKEKDVCNGEDVCCCSCGDTDDFRSLGEDDLAAMYGQAGTVASLSSDLVAVRELRTRDNCGTESADYTSFQVLEFSGDTSNLSGLLAIIADCYNNLSFENCDRLGRRIIGGDVSPLASSAVDTTSRRAAAAVRQLQVGLPRANDYPSNACGSGSCAESVNFFRVTCPANLCPAQDDLSLYLDRPRRLDVAQSVLFDEFVNLDMGSDGRRLGSVVSDSPVDFIFDQCQCLLHEPDASGTAPSIEEFIETFNRDVEATGGYEELGKLNTLTEFVSFPVAGPPKDFTVYLPVQVKGKPCSAGKEELQYLADLIKVSYNDIVAEDCDKPLFRQILSAQAEIDPTAKCKIFGYEIHVKLEFRCHGYCDPKNPLFGLYHPHLRRVEELPVDEAEQHMNLQLRTLEASKDIFSSEQDSRHLPYEDEDEDEDDKYYSNDDYYYDVDVTTDLQGVCTIEGSQNPMTPKVSKLENRVNAKLPVKGIKEISI